MTTLHDTLPARLGITAVPGAEGLDHVWVRPTPELCRHGVVRISVWALMADMMGGWVADRGAGADWVFTTDLSVRAPVPSIPSRVVGTGTQLRVGRGSVATEVRMHDEHGGLFAYAQVGFLRLARREGDAPKPELGQAAARWESRRPLDRHLDTEAGLVVIDAAEGRVEVALADHLRNPAGAMQGAMVVLVGEVAAEAVATHHRGEPCVVTDLDVRYLAMGRAGPVWSRAWAIGPPEAGCVRVELRDRGRGDRLMTVLLARTTPAP